jgi:hypothetical protein
VIITLTPSRLLFKKNWKNVGRARSTKKFQWIYNGESINGGLVVWPVFPRHSFSMHSLRNRAVLPVCTELKFGTLTVTSQIMNEFVINFKPFLNRHLIVLTVMPILVVVNTVRLTFILDRALRRSRVLPFSSPERIFVIQWLGSRWARTFKQKIVFELSIPAGTYRKLFCSLNVRLYNKCFLCRTTLFDVVQHLPRYVVRQQLGPKTHFSCK